MSKKDIRSGNTFRAFKSKFQRQYLRQSCLFRRFKKNSKVNETVLDNFNIQHDIIYSLNKKGRWEVPDMLADDILEGKYDDLKHNVQLIVSHNIDSRNHVIGYYSSQGKTRKIEGTQKSYFNRRTVISDWDLFDESNGGVQVVYPCDASSTIAYNSKKIGAFYKPRNVWDYNGGNDNTSKPRKRKKDKHWAKNYYEELKYDHYETEEDFNEIQNENLEINPEIIKNQKFKPIEEFVVSVCKYRIQKQNKRNHTPKVCSAHSHQSKDKLYYIPQKSSIDPENNPEQAENTEINLQEELTEYLRVVIPRTELEESNLKERYGDKYTNCPCFPRKFIIDISDRVEKRFTKGDSVGNFDPTSCVVFSHDTSDAQNTSTHAVFKVYLNMATYFGDSQISKMPNYFWGCISDVLQRIDTIVQTFPKDRLIEKEREPLKVSRKRLENSVPYPIGENEIIYLTRNSIYRNLFAEFKIDNINDYEFVISSPCGICFDDARDNGSSVTALASCGHSFCDACWVTYCRPNVKTGSRQITCPEHGCSEIVDETVVLAFAGVLDVVDFKRRTRELSFQTSGCAKWCPNPDCGRVIKVNNPDTTFDITCQCGTQICLHCLQQCHWPASCQSSLIYWRKLKHRGDDNLHVDLSLMQEKRGKPCPKCGKFIEKDGGCFSMMCTCGAQFCWGCLVLYENHVYTDMCFFNNGDLEGTKTLAEVEAEGYVNASTGSHYKMAVNHRKARHPVNVHVFKSGARDIKLRCKYIIRRKGSRYFSIFPGSDMLSEHELKEQIEGLLYNLLPVYNAAHLIAEYSYVLLEGLDRKFDRSSKFCINLFSLGVYTREMFELVSNTKGMTDIRPVLTSLIAIRDKTENCIKETVEIAKQMRK